MKYATRTTVNELECNDPGFLEYLSRAHLQEIADDLSKIPGFSAKQVRPGPQDTPQMAHHSLAQSVYQTEVYVATEEQMKENGCHELLNDFAIRKQSDGWYEAQKTKLPPLPPAGQISPDTVRIFRGYGKTPLLAVADLLNSEK